MQYLWDCPSSPNARLRARGVKNHFGDRGEPEGGNTDRIHAAFPSALSIVDPCLDVALIAKYTGTGSAVTVHRGRSLEKLPQLRSAL